MTIAATAALNAQPALEIYEHDRQAVLPPVTAIPLEVCKPHIDTDTLVHFTVSMPLETIAEGGPQAVSEVVGAMFDSSIELQGLEFRAVGATPGQFDKSFAGDVLLQCTCQLTPA